MLCSYNAWITGASFALTHPQSTALELKRTWIQLPGLLVHTAPTPLYEYSLVQQHSQNVRLCLTIAQVFGTSSPFHQLTTAVHLCRCGWCLCCSCLCGVVMMQWSFRNVPCIIVAMRSRSRSLRLRVAGCSGLDLLLCTYRMAVVRKKMGHPETGHHTIHYPCTRYLRYNAAATECS